MRARTVLACTLMAVASLGGLAAAEAMKVAVAPAGEVQWKDSPGMKGAKIAVVQGDPAKGAYSALKKIGGGADLGWHTHTSDQTVVVIAGTIELEIEGLGPKSMAAGSWSTMPGGTKHTARCVGTADCIYFEQQPAASDFKAIDAPKK